MLRDANWADCNIFCTFAAMKKSMERKVGALFDLDGVLLDSEGIYSQFWDAVEQQYPTHVPNFSTVIKGSNLHDILHGYYPIEDTRHRVAELLDAFQRDMPFRFFDGAMEFVSRLNHAHIPTCLVTSSDRRKMDALYCQHPDFASHFQGIVTGDMVSRAKPDPECFLLGAQMIGVDIDRCVVFEDSLKGLEAGRKAGAHVIGLATTLPHALIGPLSHRVIESFVGVTLDDLLPQ